MAEWCTIESDPAVFSELVSEIGVKNIEVEEIYSLDSAEQRKEKSHGLIFLFKWRSEVETRPILDPSESPVYFARQIVNNACATQAILSVLLNIEDFDLGETLNNFKAFTSEIDCESKGIAIGNSDVLRQVHNSFARPEPFLHEESKNASSSEEAYHFIAYVPCYGSVYEIDGLKSGPIFIGDIGDSGDWWSVAKPAIEARMNRYSASETHFALLSIGEQKKSVLELGISALSSRLSALDLIVTTGDGKSSVLPDGFVFADSTDGLAEQRGATIAALDNLKVELDIENEKLRRQKEENVRRRHNYIPMAVSLLRHLAAKGKLSGLISSANDRRATAVANKMKSKA